MSDQFRQWLTSEMEKRHYSQGMLAKTIGMSQSFVSRVLSGEKQPGVDFCVKVAQALEEPPEKVLRLAGMLPPSATSDDDTLRELMELARGLSLDQRKELLRYTRYLYQSGQEK